MILLHFASSVHYKLKLNTEIVITGSQFPFFNVFHIKITNRLYRINSVNISLNLLQFGQLCYQSQLSFGRAILGRLHVVIR